MSTVPKIIETGEFVALGTYFYQLQVGDHTETGKMGVRGYFLDTFGNGSSGGGDGGGSNSPSKRLSGRDMLQA